MFSTVSFIDVDGLLYFRYIIIDGHLSLAIISSPSFVVSFPPACSIFTMACFIHLCHIDVDGHFISGNLHSGRNKILLQPRDIFRSRLLELLHGASYQPSPSGHQSICPPSPGAGIAFLLPHMISIFLARTNVLRHIPLTNPDGQIAKHAIPPINTLLQHAIAQSPQADAR